MLVRKKIKNTEIKAIRLVGFRDVEEIMNIDPNIEFRFYLDKTIVIIISIEKKNKKNVVCKIGDWFLFEFIDNKKKNYKLNILTDKEFCKEYEKIK